MENKVVNMKYGLLISSLILLFTHAGSAQNCPYETSVPEEMFRGRYTEVDMTYGNPYTMFNRRKDNWSLSEDTSRIIRNIYAGIVDTSNVVVNDYSTIYKALYLYGANTSEPGICPEDEDCEHPKWVKNQAIVYLIGLRYSRINNRDTFTRMTQYERNQFAERAKNGLVNLNPNIISCYFGEDCGKVHKKAFDLIQYLQAYDLLKTGGYIPPNDGDRNGLDCSPRSKLREFSRNMYIQAEDVINSFRGWKKNHGIICGSSLGLAAIVLNDAGTETSWGSYLFGWIWGDGSNIPRPNYNPENWNNRAQGTGGYSPFGDGEDGIHDCFFTGDHVNSLGADDVPMTNSDGTAGYAEGPGYFNYVLKAFLPFVRARDNFIPRYKSYLGNTKYTNMFKWYLQILNQDGTLPTYDNTGYGIGNLMGVLGEPDYPGNMKYLPSDNLDLRGDYLLAMGGGDIVQKDIFVNAASGNIILRNENKGVKHTYHMLYEHDYAVDKPATNSDGTHEDIDMGGIASLRVDDDDLLIDPPYLGWDYVFNTREHSHHNVAQCYKLNDYQQNYSTPVTTIKENNDYYKEVELNIDLPDSYNINRNTLSVNSEEGLYYLLCDKFTLGSTNWAKIQFNGNGNIAEGSCTHSGRFFNWTNNCLFKQTQTYTGIYTGKWNLMAHTAVLNGSLNSPIVLPYTDSTSGTVKTIHGNSSVIEPNHLTKTRNLNEKVPYVGYHTQMSVQQNQQNTIFQTVLLPYKCNAPLPTITKEETVKHVITNIRFISNKDTSITRSLHKNAPLNPSTTAKDTVSHIHFAQWDGMVDDSLLNPFALPQHSAVVLKTNAQKAFVKHNTIGISVEGYKYCPPSYANIRHASITNGSKLTIIKGSDSLKLIEATKAVTTSLSFSARYFYVGHVKSSGSISSSDSVSFYLPDVGRGVDMCALHLSDTIPSRYDSLTNTFHMQLPSSPDYDLSFEIREKNKCADCYFPPAWMNIDTTFDADDGHNHTLGHKLKVKQNKGLLRVSNGTKIHMCEGVYLCNRDSIIIEGECQTKEKDYQLCKGLDTVAAHSSNSAIVVSPYSALVLDSGSYTYLKCGGAIYVKMNGSLVIRKGAFIQIGDSGTCQQGWGEIIADKGAYVYIDQSVYHDTTIHIEFRRTIGDTVDRNMFYIAQQATGSAYAGLSYNMIPILRADTIIPDSTHAINPIEICHIDTAVHINNKAWGYANFAKPLATYQVRKDTLCPGEPLYIKLGRLLNDSKFNITVCRVDSIYIRDKYGIMRWKDTCIVDTMSHDTTYPDPVCIEPRVAPDDLLFYFKTNSLHRITIKVWNDCGIEHDTVGYVYVMDTPKVSINMPSEICEGVGTATAYITKFNNFPISSYTFEITEIPDPALMKVRTGITQSYSKTYYDTLPDSFNFDDYYFKGGRKYSISLTVTSACGGETFYTETTVPLAAKIVAGKPTVYAEPIAGATSVKLQGHINAADSFAWLPHDWLNRTDTLSIISTPHESVSYILSAYKGACVARDTISIRYNELSNIGTNDTLCYNNNIIALGNHYNAAMFLGWLQYYDVIDVNTELRNIIANLNNDDIYFDRYLKYFDSYMLAGRFKESQDTSCFAYYDLFKNSETYNWDMIFKDSLFVTYYNNYLPYIEGELLDKSIASTKINRFKTFIRDAGFKTIIEKHPIDSTKLRCFKYLFVNYESYLRGIYDESYYPMNVNWSKIEGQDTSSIDWENEYIAIVNPTKTTTYIQQALFSYGDISIDTKTIFIDTALAPLYYPSMQWDSSAYFSNATSPSSSTNTYLWNFGDGSATSTDVNPFHTYPAFDSNYVVCLTATNKCGSYTHCDTVWIDSLHIGGGYKVIAMGHPERSEGTQDASHLSMTKGSNSTNHPTTNNCQLSNYPNPFDQSTIIDYEIWQTYSKAELRITNVLGQEVYIQRLNRPMDKVQIDGSALHDGLYYYSLIVDGTVKLTKTMIAIR